MKRLALRSNELDGLVNLYYLLIHADGRVSERELKMGEIMCSYEKIDKEIFRQKIEIAHNLKKDDIYKKCVDSLRNCEHEFTVKCIAWMSLIANSDGFMSTEEWGLIYKLYAYELHLDLKEILTYQKSLPKN